MGSPRVIADPATLIAIVWFIIATFSTLVDAFYASKITLKPSYTTREFIRTKTSSKAFTKRVIQFILFISITLLVLSTIVLALNTSTVETRSSPQILVAPIQIQTSGREQVYRDFVRVFLRDLNQRPSAPVVMAPPAPISGLHERPTSINMVATQLSSLIPLAMVYTTLWAVISDVLDFPWSHFPALVVVACATVRRTFRSGLRVVFVLLHTECVWVVRIALAIVWGLLEDLLSPLIYWVELELASIKYFVRFSGAPLLIRGVNSLSHAHARYSITSVLTQLLRHNFFLQYTIAFATLTLARLFVGMLIKKYYVRLAEALAFLRRAAATALMVLAIRLDPPQGRGILDQAPSTPQGQEATKEVTEALKDQEGTPAVEGSPAAISPSSENAPVDLSVFPVLDNRLMIDKGPREICESNRSLLRTMMNDQRPESTRLVSIHPPSATVLAVIEELLKDPASALRGSPRNIRLTGSELVYVFIAVIEECNRRHQIVHDGLVKSNEGAEARIRSEARKYRALALELNALKSELKRKRESVVEGKDICTSATSTGDSVTQQSEDGETASASKLEPAATSSHAGKATKAPAEDDTTSLQTLLSDLRGLRNLVRAMLMPDHCSELEKSGEVDPFSINSGPHRRVRDLIASCDLARTEILRVISLLAVQRSADSKHNYAVLKRQQVFREELSDRVTELRKEYESQLEDLYQQLHREKVAHDHTKAFSDLYLRLHSKREHSLQEEVEKRKEEVTQLQKDVYCLQRKVKDTEALKEELFRPVDLKDWVLQWFSRRDISRVTGTILETRYRNAMKDLDKVIAQMDVFATQSDLVNQHAELLQYICSKLFKLDSGVAAPPSSTHSNKKDRRLVKPTLPV